VSATVRILLFIALTAAAAAAAGCGGSAGTDELLVPLPPDPPLLATVDLTAAKERLGLETDADPTAPQGDAGSEDLRLLFAAGLVLPHLLRPESDLPISEALDAERIEAAVTAGLRDEGQLTVVRTEQSADEVLEALEREGYKRDGDLVRTDESLFKVVYAAAAERNGVLLLGGSAKAVRKGLNAEDGGAGPARDLLDELEGTVRVAASATGSGCLRGLGGGDRLDPPGGELIMRVKGKADPGATPLGGGQEVERPLTRGVRFDEPEADGGRLRIPFSYDPGVAGVSPLGLVTGDLPASAFYRCAGGGSDPPGG